MPVPFLSRLNITEYVGLVGSFLLVGLESVIRVLTLALPVSLLSLFYRVSRRLFNRWTSPEERRAGQRRKSISTSIRDASDFVDLCAMFGYTAEEHVMQTKDGYLLGLHRLAWRKGEEDTKVNNGPQSVKKRVVYLHHGLLMNSEVWVCLTDAQRALPFVLVDRGFDVWFGNNRGNKYSKKSVHCRPTSVEFWNFSIDEFAFHDIPDSIRYILETTNQTSLSYIGFSQGTAQAFATLAVHPKLNNQVNVFIALAPAMSPAGLHNGIVDALVKVSPQVLFLLFGRRSILSSATMWQSILYPPLFAKMIDYALSFLFNWQTKNISTSQKLAAYPHLYSFTSTKSVVHWFQIIRNKSFQMYDDDVHPPLSLSTSSKYTKVAKYPTRNIRTPVVLIYGGSDSLVDIRVMLRELPKQTVATEVPHYEHLDFLWARDVDTQVFPHVFDALESFTGAEHTKEEYERYRSARHSSLSASAALKHHEPRNNDVLDSDVSTVLGGGSSGDPEPELEGDNSRAMLLAGDDASTASWRGAGTDADVGLGGDSIPIAVAATPTAAPTPMTARQPSQTRKSQIPTPMGNWLERPVPNLSGGRTAGLPLDDEPFVSSRKLSTPDASARFFAGAGSRADASGGGGIVAALDRVMDSHDEDGERAEGNASLIASTPSSSSPALLGSGIFGVLPESPSVAAALKRRRRPSSGSGISLGTSRAVGGLVTTSGVEAAGLMGGLASPGSEEGGRGGGLRRKRTGSGK